MYEHHGSDIVEVYSSPRIVAEAAIKAWKRLGLHFNLDWEEASSHPATSFYIPLDPCGWVILRTINVGVVVVKISRVDLLVLTTGPAPDEGVIQIKSDSDEK